MSALMSSRPPSERRFGLILAAVFFALSVCEFVGRRTPFSYSAWLIAGACFCLVVALLAPHFLAPLNKAWLYLGECLGKIVSPIVLGVLFFGLLTPLAAIARLCGRDELRLKRRPGRSYWINSSQPRPAADSFKNPY